MAANKKVYFDGVKQVYVKPCARCREVQDVAQFYFNKKRGYYDTYCRTCLRSDNQNRYKRTYRKKIKDSGLFDTRRAMVYKARDRAKAKGLPIDIKVDDISLEEFCPVFGTKLRYSLNDCNADTPSLDRVVPQRGYVKGNVRIISQRANCVKHDKSLAELEATAANLRDRLTDIEEVIRYVREHLASQSGDV